jgi:Ubiquitin-activating enzyme active site
VRISANAFKGLHATCLAHVQRLCRDGHNVQVVMLLRVEDCVHRYLDDAVNAGDSAARERLERVAEVLVTERCRSFEDCVAWARRLFEVNLCQS